MTPKLAQNPSKGHITYQAIASADCCCPAPRTWMQHRANEVARNSQTSCYLRTSVVATPPFYYIVMGKKSHVDSQVKKQILLLVVNFVIYDIFLFAEISLLPCV